MGDARYHDVAFTEAEWKAWADSMWRAVVPGGRLLIFCNQRSGLKHDLESWLWREDERVQVDELLWDNMVRAPFSLSSLRGMTRTLLFLTGHARAERDSSDSEPRHDPRPLEKGRGQEDVQVSTRECEEAPPPPRMFHGSLTRI